MGADQIFGNNDSQCKLSEKSQMIKPEKLFPLPQDKYLKPSQPQSTPEQFKKFLEKVKGMGVKI